MISADQALINARRFRECDIDRFKNGFLWFVNDFLDPRIKMASSAGEFRATLDVSYYDARIRGFYNSLREQLMKSGFGFDFTNYPEEIVIMW